MNKMFAMKEFIEIIPNISRFGFNTIWATGYRSYTPLSANFKISYLLYKGLTDGLVWWFCIGAEVELDNITEIWLWYSYVKMSQWLKPLFSGRSGGVGSTTFFWKMHQISIVTIIVIIVCVSCIFLLFCNLHLSPAITFGPDFTFNNSINDFLPCAPSFHFIHKQKYQIWFCYINSFQAFWPNHVVNGLVLILSWPTSTLTWSLLRNTNGKHFDRSYIFRLNILSLWYLNQVLSPIGQ